jgi:ribosomal protein L20A (L18A)
MKLEKVAEKDAARWAAAKMFYGEGAGVRRRLLEAEIAHKTENISGYHEMFQKAFSKQNLAEHAYKAMKERQKIDRTNIVGKNVRALARGDVRGMSTGLIVVIGAGYIAHATGYDKIAIDKSKMYYRQLKRKYNEKKRNLHLV